MLAQLVLVPLTDFLRPPVFLNSGVTLPKIVNTRPILSEFSLIKEKLQESSFSECSTLDKQRMLHKMHYRTAGKRTSYYSYAKEPQCWQT